jgi:hypothetical protein
MSCCCVYVRHLGAALTSADGTTELLSREFPWRLLVGKGTRDLIASAGGHTRISSQGPVVSKVGTGRVRIFFSFMGWGETVDVLYQPRIMDGDECAAVDRIIGTGNRSLWRKPAAVLICPPQNPYDLTWARTRAAAVG